MKRGTLSASLYSDVNTKPLGFCMYCGSKQHLTKEHIMPRFLKGAWVFPKSSCEECRGITKTFERLVANEIFGGYRLTRGLKPSSKKVSLPKHIPVKLRAGDVVRQKMISVDEAPQIPLWLPVFPPPGILAKSEPKPLTEIGIGWWASFIDLNHHPEQKHLWIAAADSTADDISFGNEFTPENLIAFAQMLTKIAHGAAMADFRGLIQSWLPDYILGKNQNFAYVLGNADVEISVPIKYELNRGKITNTTTRAFIYEHAAAEKYLVIGIEIVRNLYTGAASASTPRLFPYVIVVSEASDELANAVLSKQA